MTAKNFFRPDTSHDPVTGPLHRPSTLALHTAARTVQATSVLLIATVVLALIAVFSVPMRFDPDTTQALAGIAVLLVALLWIASIAMLAATLAASAQPEPDPAPAPSSTDDTPRCSACGFHLTGSETACPDCGIAFVDA